MDNQNVPAPVPGKGMAIASLVLGISGLCFSVFGGFVLGIVGFILGLKGKKQLIAAGQPYGIATAGIICSIIGAALGLLLFILFGITILCAICGAGISAQM